MQTDSLFYRIFQSAPGLFFELIGQSQTLAEAYTFRSVELKQTAFRIDGVFLPDQPEPLNTVYFLEVQFQKDEQLYRRLFAEICLFLRQNPNILVWNAVVLYAGRATEPSDPRPYQNWLDAPDIQLIYLDELNDIPPSPGIDILKLITEPETSAIAKAKTLLNQNQQGPINGLDQKAIIELVETIIVYKFPQLSRQEIEAMLELSGLKQTKVYQEAHAEGLEQGLAQGLAQGLEQGLEEGKRQEGIALITRLLVRKFGDLSPEIQISLSQLSREQVGALADAWMDFSTVDDVSNWLSTVTSENESP